MSARPTRVRTGVKPGQSRTTKTNHKQSASDPAMDRTRCTEIAMLAAARGWGKKRSS